MQNMRPWETYAFLYRSLCNMYAHIAGSMHNMHPLYTSAERERER